MIDAAAATKKWLVAGICFLVTATPVIGDETDADWQENLAYVDTDDIAPILIRHHVDEVVSEGVVHQKYNYLLYRFERDDVYITARAYFDDVESVSLYGPFKSDEGDGSIEVDDDKFFGLVLDYMKRRYVKITQLKTGEGYVAIWPVGDGDE